jgi:hypothetical protein
MKEENKNKFKKFLKNYLEKNDLYLYQDIVTNTYCFKLNEPKKEKKQNNDYQLESFIKKFELPLDKNSNNYKFWQYIEQKDKDFSHELITTYIKYPSKDYIREEYINKIFELYTNNKKNNTILWSIIKTKTFLNNNIKIIEKLFNEEVLSDSQKQEIIEYYINFIQKSAKFNTLENKRLISVLNKKLIKPLEISLIEEKDLKIETKKENCVYFEIKIQDLMSYSLKLSKNFSENLLYQFHNLLPKVLESETKNIIFRKNLESYEYAILTNLNEELIKHIFKSFVDHYIKLIINEDKFPSTEDILDCLRFSTIKARKEKLENQFELKNIKNKLNKI